MLISESFAKVIVTELKNTFKKIPTISEQGVREISFKFMEPTLELLEEMLEDFENSNLILTELLSVLDSNVFPLESVISVTGLNEEASPDEFLKKYTLKIIEKHVKKDEVRPESLDPIEEQADTDEVHAESLQSTIAIIYNIMYSLVHEYAFGKNPRNRIAEKITPIVMEDESIVRPKIWEIEHVVIRCLEIKKYQIKLIEDSKDEEKAARCLMFASLYGYTDTIEFLLKERKVNPNVIVDGLSALSVACESGNMPAVDLLLQNNADVAMIGNKNTTALHFACYGGYSNIVRLLLNQKDVEKIIDSPSDEGCTPLMVAVIRGYYAIVKMLLEKNANLQICEKRNINVLYAACELGYYDFVELLLSHRDISTIINKGNDNDFTALMMAAQKGFLPIIEALCAKNANVNYKTKEGNTAYMLACEKGHLGVVQALIKNGADFTTINSGMCTGLFIACQNGHTSVVEFLLEQIGIEKIMDYPRKDGFTPLVISVHMGFLPIVELLFKKSTNLMASAGLALYIACEKMHVQIVQFLLVQKDIEKIIDFTFEDGSTPLMIASQNGSVPIVEMLLNKNVDSEDKLNEKTIALSLATRYHHGEIVRLLMSAENSINRPSALIFSREVNNKHTDEFILALNRTGIDKFKSEKYQESVDIFKEILNYWESDDREKDTNTKNNIAATLYNLGATERKLNNFKRATECFEKAIFICESIGDHVRQEKYLRSLQECKNISITCPIN